MPIYSYECKDCGVFESIAPMSKFSEPCNCPSCGKTSQRVINSAPFVSVLPSSVRKAHSVNERSADSPKKLSTHGPVGAKGIKRNRRTVTAPDGSKAFAGSRPWMLSH